MQLNIIQWTVQIYEYTVVLNKKLFNSKKKKKIVLLYMQQYNT